MIRFYAIQLAQDDLAKIKAIKALRLARQLCGAIDTSLVTAKADVDRLFEADAGELLVCQTDDIEQAQRVPSILNDSPLTWRVDDESGETPVPVELAPEDQPAEPAEPTGAIIPTLEAGQIACILLAVCEGNIGNALSAAQSISRTLGEDGKGDEFWNEVLVMLLDSFPIAGLGVNESVQQLAARLDAGGA